MHTIRWVSPQALKPNPRNARTHSKKQIRQIADSIVAFGFTVPLLVDESHMILAGHGRLEAAKLLGLSEVPVIVLEGLSEAKKRALLLADNKIAENAGWDRERLAIELPELAELLIDEDLDISITGFEPVEIDQIAQRFRGGQRGSGRRHGQRLADGSGGQQAGRPLAARQASPLCAATRAMAITSIASWAGKSAAMAFLDPPYNVRIRGVVGRGRVKHGEFAMASGEMSPQRVHCLSGGDARERRPRLPRRRGPFRLHGLAAYRAS